VIITEYDLPRPEAMPHDAAIDAEGLIWYSDFDHSIWASSIPRPPKRWSIQFR
jgi:streptogramin lyase